MKQLDDNYGKHAYAKHITNFVRKRLYYDQIDNLELTNWQEPDIALMNDDHVEAFIARCIEEEK